MIWHCTNTSLSRKREGSERSCHRIVDCKSNINDYTRIYNDTEGLGQGTIAGIINQIQELK